MVIVSPSPLGTTWWVFVKLRVLSQLLVNSFKVFNKWIRLGLEKSPDED